MRRLVRREVEEESRREREEAITSAVAEAEERWQREQERATQVDVT